MQDSLKVIILAGGLSKRWGRYNGVEKHFAPVEGVPILENTIRLLSKYDLSVSIICREDCVDDYEELGCDVAPIPAEWSSKEYYKIKSTIDLWNPNGRTIILMGDVWFTARSIGKIVRYNKRKIVFFGRQRRSFHTLCNHGELFALSFWPNHFKEMITACEELEHYMEGKGAYIAGGWGIYDIVSSLRFLMYPKVVRGFVFNSNFLNISDLTDDIDTPKDYNNLLNALRRPRVCHIIASITSSLYYSFWFIFNAFFEFFVRFINTHSGMLSKLPDME